MAIGSGRPSPQIPAMGGKQGKARLRVEHSYLGDCRQGRDEISDVIELGNEDALNASAIINGMSRVNDTRRFWVLPKIVRRG